MDAAAWDERYRRTDLVWEADPDPVVVAETSGMRPGRVLDLGCGEGRHAIWLAHRGWTTTGIDFSRVAVDRADGLSRAAGVSSRTTWLRSDTATAVLSRRAYDLVLAVHLPLSPARRRATLVAAVPALAPGGTLLVVGRDPTDPADPGTDDGSFTPQQVLADLAGPVQRREVEVEHAERRHRVDAASGLAGVDAVVRMRRPR